MWRHVPWMAGLAAAPILHGAVNSEGQGVVGACFALSLLAMIPVWRRIEAPILPRWLCVALLLMLVLPLLPIPPGLHRLFSPNAAELAQRFPLEAAGSPGWMPWALSPAYAVQRLYEIALLVACFCLARQAANERGFAPLLVAFIGVAMVLLAVSEVWYRRHGRAEILGLWPTTWGNGAGTFANRNHFADWMNVGALFLAGWGLRGWHPLRGARIPGAPVAKNVVAGTIACGVAILGVGMAVMSGSRGGLAVLLAGFLVWFFLLKRRTKQRTRIGPLVIAIVVLVSLLAPLGQQLVRRLGETHSEISGQYYKTTLWVESIRLLQKFPFVGIGWGCFGTAFNHYKTSIGSATAHHAENDYLQTIVEGGAVGTGPIMLAIWIVIRRVRNSVLFSRFGEPELVFGAVAGLAGFTVHAVFEFVFQVPATAILAAALLGFLVGQCEGTGEPVVHRPASDLVRVFLVTGGLMLGWMGLEQVAAFADWRRALVAARPDEMAASITRSLEHWPWPTYRQIGRVRARVAALPSLGRLEQRIAAARIREELNLALRRDPYSWELRRERAWLDLEYSTDRERARAEVWEAVRLNPLYARIPLEFAHRYLDRDPAMTRALLRAAKLSTRAEIEEALRMAWALSEDPEELKAVTPNSVNGWTVLAEFSADRGLQPLAEYSRRQLALVARPDGRH